MTDITQFRTAVETKRFRYSLPYRMTIGDYHTLSKMFKKCKTLKPSFEDVVFLGDLELNCWAVDFNKMEYVKMSREDIRSRFSDIEYVNRLYRYTTEMKKYKKTIDDTESRKVDREQEDASC